MDQFIRQAIYYSHNSSLDLGEAFMRGIVLSARATLKGLQKADFLTEDEIKSCSQDFWFEGFDLPISFWKLCKILLIFLIPFTAKCANYNWILNLSSRSTKTYFAILKVIYTMQLILTGCFSSRNRIWTTTRCVRLLHRLLFKHQKPDTNGNYG